MTDEKLIHPPALGAGESAELQVRENGAAPPSPFLEESYYPRFEEEAGGVDLRRYLFAILRYKWLLALALVVGTAGTYVAWTSVQATYTAEGNLWIEVESRRTSDVGPIRAGGLLEANAWIELLRSYQVLDTVAVRERLFLQVPSQHAPAFERFELEDQYTPGQYVLTVSQFGEDFVLTTGAGPPPSGPPAV